MNMPRGAKPNVDKYQVRFYDGFDYRWINVTAEPLSYEEAFCFWAIKTKNGTIYSCYNDIDYYDIFPFDTKMIFD